MPPRVWLQSPPSCRSICLHPSRAGGSPLRLLVMLSSLSLGAAAPSWPRFSWATAPVFYHSCNFTGPYTDSAIATIAKFPLVTIEKGQGVTLGTGGEAGYAEDKIVTTLKRVKAANANISTIFYYNSVLDWPF